MYRAFCVTSFRAANCRHPFECILGGIDAGLGASLILVGAATTDADPADVHPILGHNRQSAGKCGDAGNLRYPGHRASLEILAMDQLLYTVRRKRESRRFLTMARHRMVTFG